MRTPLGVRQQTLPLPGSFDRFLATHKDALKRIARATRGESTVDDVVQEAWLMAHRLHGERLATVDFDEAQSQRVLAHLFQALVRYTDTRVRHAVRLDHAPNGDDDAVHPLARILSGDPGDDPLAGLAAAEDAAAAARVEPATQAAAWLVMVQHFGNRMQSVADFLKISTSYAYRCCARARGIATRQRGIVLDAQMAALRPWRRWRAERRPRQLCFDFGVGPSLFDVDVAAARCSDGD